jgi:hypothetical protein
MRLCAKQLPSEQKKGRLSRADLAMPLHRARVMTVRIAEPVSLAISHQADVALAANHRLIGQRQVATMVGSLMVAAKLQAAPAVAHVRLVRDNWQGC